MHITELNCKQWCCWNQEIRTFVWHLQLQIKLEILVFLSATYLQLCTLTSSNICKMTFPIPIQLPVPSESFSFSRNIKRIKMKNSLFKIKVSIRLYSTIVNQSWSKYSNYSNNLNSSVPKVLFVYMFGFKGPILF